MQIKANRIIFKTNPEMYGKERKGWKTNTVRICNLKEHEEITNHLIRTIQINEVGSERCFRMPLKDISFMQPQALDDRFYIYIFSW